MSAILGFENKTLHTMSNKILFDASIEKLEQIGNDDFKLLHDLGASYFGTEHLQELGERARKNLAVFNKKLRFGMLLGATSAGWALFAIVLLEMRFPFFALFAFGMMSLSLVGFLAIILLLKKQYESKGELEYTQRVIEIELKKRHKRQGQL
jgi:hypothetical protein